jgi:hypothetical protein
MLFFRRKRRRSMATAAYEYTTGLLDSDEGFDGGWTRIWTRI